MAYANDILSTRISLIDRIQHFAHDMAQRRQRAAVYSRTCKELNALTNRELADIGLNRGMIEAVARAAASEI